MDNDCRKHFDFHWHRDLFFYNKLTWIGRLPGDIRIEKENSLSPSQIFLPVTHLLL